LLQQRYFCGMSLAVAYAPNYVHPVPEGHRFPMEKYSLLHYQLQLEGLVAPEQFFEPGRIDLAIAGNVHTSAYLDRLLKLQCSPREQRVSGFEHSQTLIERELTIMEGTRKCAEIAVRNGGAALNIAGGTHHAYANRGEGFCLLNDNAIGAQWLLDEQLAKKVLIIDLDVHQGNGTAEIFLQNPDVFTFSMHGEHNYPLHKEKSDLDIALPDGIRDKEYLYLLERSLNDILQQFIPDAVFYQCGVDIIESDKLGRLGVSLNGCRQRDEVVFRFIKQLEVPVICSMGGGYSKEIKYIIEAHANTFRAAQLILG
jgi:acetoin utilization deacetylase AcuC-like enzyme